MRFFRKSNEPDFLKEISKVFSFRVRTFGGTPAGVLWKNSEGQQLRFEVLSGILFDQQPTSSVSPTLFSTCGPLDISHDDDRPNVPHMSFDFP